MSLPRFFLENQVLAAETEAVFPLRLALDDAKHARVLRLAAGEHIAVIDADQDYFECEIVDFADELPLVSIARHEDASEAGPQVILLQGLAKGDKMETVIRHATEVGVAAFVPLACARSIVKLDGKPVDESTLASVLLFISCYAMITLGASLVVALNDFPFTETLTSVITCISNTGPGLGAVGPAGNFSAFSPLSKLVLSLCMIIGRLEIFPILVMFSRSTWRRV